MPNSERDAMFVALNNLGFNGNTTSEKELNAAANLLKKQKKNVQAYLLDEAARVKLEAGNADIAVIYNGEAYLAFENNDKLAFTIPEEGTCMWLDAFAIPANADSPELAEKFIDFLCREDIAKINFEYIYYSTPNKAVVDSLDAEILEETAIFPNENVVKNATVLKYLGEEAEKLYSKLWKNVKA
jgi:spermidine/putrescine-binding protein